jgi:hypothetical protein
MRLMHDERSEMSTEPTHTSTESTAEIADTLASFLAGAGILTTVLFPFALPLLGLVLVPLVALGLVLAVVAGILSAPVLLIRRLARVRVRRPARLELAGVDGRLRAS